MRKKFKCKECHLEFDDSTKIMPGVKLQELGDNGKPKSTEELPTLECPGCGSLSFEEFK